MGSPEPPILAIIENTQNWPFWTNLGAPKYGKIVGFKYRESQSWDKGSNRTINTEVVNIGGPWFMKHKIEACL